MSESREHKKRYNQKLQFVAAFEKWLSEEPPMILFWKWNRWKNSRPILFKEGDAVAGQSQQG